MKVTEKQLTLIFCIVAAILFGAYYISQTPPVAPVVPLNEARNVSPIVPLSPEDRAFVDQALSGKPTPLNAEDKVLVKKNLSEKVIPPSDEEAAQIKKVLGI